MFTLSGVVQSICAISFLYLPVMGQAATSAVTPATDATQQRFALHATMMAQNSSEQAESVTQPDSMVADEPRSVDSLDDIAIQLINPISKLMRLETDFNYNTYDGSLPDADDQGNWNISIKSHFPVSMSNGKTLLFRLEIPIILTEPVFESDAVYPDYQIRQSTMTMSTDGTFVDQHSHLDDLRFDVAYGGVSENGFISMFALNTVLPVSTDTSNSRHQLQIGPEYAFGKITPWGIAGARLKHMIDVVGDDDFDTNITSIKVFYAYGLGNGWQIISNPEIVYDWAADSDNRLFLPIGAGIAKTSKIASMPVRFSVELQKYLVSPDFYGPDWLLRFSVTPAIAYPWSR